MLVKEYRIPLPLSVEEYRVAQLYMIAVSTQIIFKISFELFIIFNLCRKKVGKKVKVQRVELKSW